MVGRVVLVKDISPHETERALWKRETVRNDSLCHALAIPMLQSDCGSELQLEH